jgi:ParB family chromosome partitioning protein
MQNLTVIKQCDTKGNHTGKYAVVAGGRRFAALRELASKKKITKNTAVPCRVVEAGAATEASLAENIIRVAMHPADQFDAFVKLVEEGRGIEEIAARFGVSSTVVQQRLKLAKVSPRLVAAYRADKVGLDQLMALAITEDQAAQERVWDAARTDWQREPRALRRALTENKVDASSDARARFVGVAAYLNDGGLIERDLFQPEHEGYLLDPAKLDRLVSEKLERLGTEVKGEGWGWVEILLGDDYRELAKFDRIYPVHAPLSDEILKEIETLQQEQQQIETKYHDAEEYPLEVEARMEAIEIRIEELNDQPRQFREEEKALAGVIVSLQNDGQPSVYRGLVRSEDKKKIRALKSDINGGGEPNDGQVDEVEEENLSGALVEDLTAHRTAALRAVLATRAEVALIAVTHSLALGVCYEGCYNYKVGSCLSLTSEKGACRLDSHAKGIATSLAQTRLSKIHCEWLRRIPANPEELWQWLLGQEQTVVMELLAFCVGQTVHAVQFHHDSSSDPRLVAAGDLAVALGLDMADWWQPTAETYLGRVKKEQILEAIKEGSKEQDLENLRKLKKTELVAAAERRLADSRWLPAILKS